MANGKKEHVVSTDFKGIQTVSDLRKYLDDCNNRLKSSKYLYHYTTLNNVVKILCGGSWHLGSASCMNDELEYRNGDSRVWKNLFFSCFMCEDEESIGMWSMYAQPWERGVKVALPSKAVREWINDAKELIEISDISYTPTGKRIPLEKDKVSVRLSMVAYSNADSCSNQTDEKLTWSNKTNRNILNAVRIPELTGYVKDMAWSYEKEIRIKAEFLDASEIMRVALPLTDNLISQMVITASPLFEGDLRNELEKLVLEELGNGVGIERLLPMRMDSSIFTHRLNIKTVCQSCKIKRHYQKSSETNEKTE